MPTLAMLAAVFTELGTSGSTFCGATGSTARAWPNAEASAIAIAERLKVLVRFMFDTSPAGQRRNVRSLAISRGLFVPWMLVWQFTQPRASVLAPVLVPVSEATLPRWLVGSWHDWQSMGWRSLSRLGAVVPCGLWQIEQSSCTGWCVRTNGPRFSMWQV